MSAFVDLHCHYLPGIDDGARTREDGLEMLRGLGAVGYARVVATPHIRTAMFDNRRPGLEAAYAAFAERAAGLDGLPATGLGAEHYLDDVFWSLFVEGAHLPYPGGRAALVEMPYDRLPARVEHRLFEMQVRGVRPVIAHPERCSPLYRSTDPLDPLLEVGAVALLDLMSLIGRYGRRPEQAALRMLEEGVYYAACTDAHRPSDVPLVAEAIAKLRELVDAEEVEELLELGPLDILDGTVEP